MFYKLGLEFFNGSITTLATDRFNASNAFTKLGAAQGVNQAAQCVGAILVSPRPRAVRQIELVLIVSPPSPPPQIAPLVKAFPTRTVLSGAVLFFGLMTTILLIVSLARALICVPS